MTTPARRLDRTRSFAGTLLAGLLLLYAALRAPRARLEAYGWHESAVVVASHATSIRSHDLTVRTPRIVERIGLFTLPDRVTLDCVPAARSARTTGPRTDPARTVTERGYDATAPPTFS